MPRSIACALACLLTTGIAIAGELRPGGSRSIRLTGFDGIVYYTAEQSRYRVVAPLAYGREGLPVRVISELGPARLISISAPPPVNQPSVDFEILRDGDTLRVSGFVSAVMADLAEAVAIGSAADESHRAPLHAFQTAQSEIGVFRPSEEPVLYTLVLLVCEEAAPHQCETYEQIVEGLGMHPGTAFIQAQPLVEQWRQSHPGYVVRQWRLRPGRGA